MSMMKRRNVILLFSVLAAVLIVAWLTHRQKTQPSEPGTSGLSEVSKEVEDVPPPTKVVPALAQGTVLSNLPAGVPYAYRF